MTAPKLSRSWNTHNGASMPQWHLNPNFILICNTFLVSFSDRIQLGKCRPWSLYIQHPGLLVSITCCTNNIKRCPRGDLTVAQHIKDLVLSLWQRRFAPWLDSGLRIWGCRSCGLGTSICRGYGQKKGVLSTVVRRYIPSCTHYPRATLVHNVASSQKK